MNSPKVLKIVGYVVAGVLVALMGLGTLTAEQALSVVSLILWLQPALGREIQAVLPRKDGAQ